MDKFYFIPSSAGFIPEKWKKDGTFDESNWPRDAVLMNDAEVSTYKLSAPPPGKTVGGDRAGRPVWVDVVIPPDTLAQVLEKRQAAYAAESDPIKLEIEFEALKNGTAPDYRPWIEAVENIKTRLPKPETYQ